MNREKSSLRRELRTRLLAFAPAERSAASNRMCAALAARWPGHFGQMIAGFLPLPDEPDLSAFYRHVRTGGGQLAFPRLTGPGLMEFRALPSSAPEFSHTPVHSSALDAAGIPSFRLGSHGLLEPDPSVCPSVEAAEFTRILVPGLGFAAGGARLGRGAGYYDRWLAAAPPSLESVGIAFSCQLLPNLPSEPHDRPVGAILTEDGWTTGTPVGISPRS